MIGLPTKFRENLHCLLIQPRFPDASFWNYRSTCELIDAKTPNVPLGLLTVAAILPQTWSFRLVDLNASEVSEEDWQWADIVALGGMLPQQKSILELMRMAQQKGKFTVVGGTDPTSQPEVYQAADALVLDEGEITIPMWIESWKNGTPRGVFRTPDKADMSLSPPPRYDLLRLEDYDHVAMQISRGCPFNCEFCDIIELFGRKPRTKTPQQVEAELQAILRTGYTGCVDIVDDNFIGNIRLIRKTILPVITSWNKRYMRPFVFTTEASMNLADDHNLMESMREAGFRFIFTGIETPDPEILLKTQKSQNTTGSIPDRIKRLLQHGMVPTAGFIIGFDGEKKGMDQRIISCIEEAPIAVAMAGLLVALPNTQLTRRLQKEGRLLLLNGANASEAGQSTAVVQESIFEVADQTVGGLNFVTQRDRYEILGEFRSVIGTIYAPRAFMDRVLRQILLFRGQPPRLPGIWELKREIKGLWRLSVLMSKNKELRWLYWRNFFVGLWRGHHQFDMAMRLMAFYVHFHGQKDYVLKKTAEDAEKRTFAQPAAKTA